MALTPAFTITQLSDPSAIILTDTSTGSDGAITDRKINLYDVSNNIYGSSPYDWPIAGSSITINPLQKDKSLLIVVTWVNNVGAVLYTLGQVFAFVGYAEQFFSGLTRNQVSQPTITADQQYYQNKSKLRVLIDSAIQAITSMNDIYNAQNCIDLYTPLLNNPQLYF